MKRSSRRCWRCRRTARRHSGLMDVHRDGSSIRECRFMLDSSLAKRLRARSRALGVSATSIWHVAWALVLARTSGQKDPVFGTVLFGRMQGGEGMDRAFGMFINTLPVRIRLTDMGAKQCILEAHRCLAGLLDHEHASLALAQTVQRSSGADPIVHETLFNYRHSSLRSDGPRPKILTMGSHLLVAKCALIIPYHYRLMIWERILGWSHKPPTR